MALQAFPAALVAAGKSCDAKSKGLADKAKSGEIIDRRARGPPRLHIFAAGVHYVATRQWAEGANAVKEKALKAGAEEFWENTISKLPMAQIGCAV
eukprot:2755497-Pyramimonas_sp.AAC.1